MTPRVTFYLRISLIASPQGRHCAGVEPASSLGDNTVYTNSGVIRPCGVLCPYKSLVKYGPSVGGRTQTCGSTNRRANH